MVRKVLNPKVLIHLSISPDIKKFLMDHNINASELLEKAVLELMDIANQGNQENILEYYPDIKRKLESYNIFVIPYQFEDKAYYRELQIKALSILRNKLGFSYEDSKKILEKYIKEKQKEIFENIDSYKDSHYEVKNY